MSLTRERDPDEVVWHDAENGGYRGDIDLWLRLATERSGPILDLGAGTGRVSLALARRGHRVWALDRDPGLLAALEQRASHQGLQVGMVAADCRERGPIFGGVRFSTIIAPMQLFQLLSSSEDRRAALLAQRERLAPGGLMTIVLLDRIGELFSGMPEPLPDVRERAEWIFSSTPVDVACDERGVSVRRRRERISPAGEMEESSHEITLHALAPATLEAEARECGYRPLGRERIDPTNEHVGSIAVHLEVEDGAG
ncbi:MAG: class I SAM-dependent methyltransferase [Solirubrobacterales bacterium]